MKIVDLIITGGTICTMNSHRDIIDSSSIIIDKGQIIDILPSQDTLGVYQSQKTINANNCIVMPGLVNTHTHSALTFFRGISDDLPLMDWLKRYIWPIEGKFVTSDFVRLSTELAIYEMVLSGTTTFNDSYFFSREVADISKNLGVRCVSGEIILDFPTPSHKTPDEALEYVKANIEKWKGDELITISIAPHSLYGCSKELLVKAKKLATDNNILFNIHISESESEVSEIKKLYGGTPVEVLHQWGILDKNVVAAHCVHLSENDEQLLAEKGVGISHNPESNLKLGNGVAPISSLLQRGAIVGLGTDGAASNNNLSLLAEIDFAAKLQKGFYKDSTLMTGQASVEMLTINGAKVLHLEDKIGSLEVGKCADIIVIDIKKPHLTPMYSPYSHIVYAAEAADVVHVVINGKTIVENSKFLNWNFDFINQKALEYGQHIKRFLDENK